MPRIATRFAVAAVSMVFALLVSEGLYSLMTGGSLIRLDLGVRAERVRRLDDAERARAADLTPGPFALDVDPVVGTRMKASVTREIVGVAATTDEWGQRVRRGPPPEEGALRIVVLGDSVAFGFGVADDETYGHRLEEMLRAAVVDGPKPVVQTVACPGWNAVGAVRYLEGHLERLDPDLVVFLPTRNDLDDVSLVNEAGYHSEDFTLLGGAQSPPMSLAQYFDRAAWMGGRLATAKQLEVATAGGRWWETLRYALYSGMGPTSKARWAAFHGAVHGLFARLKRREAELVVALRWDSAFMRQVELDLRRRTGEGPSVLSMFDEERPEDALEKDTHPNAECIRAGATVIAGHLVGEGLVPGAETGRLPELGPAYSGRRRRRFTMAELEAWHADLAEKNARFCVDTVAVESGLGFHQVYGGLDEDGWVGRCASFLLPGASRRIVATLRFEDETLAPLGIDLALEGAEGVGGPFPVVVEATPGRDVKLTWEVPEELRSAPFLDVHLRAHRWAVRRVDGRMRVRAFRLLELRAER